LADATWTTDCVRPGLLYDNTNYLHVKTQPEGLTLLHEVNNDTT